MGFIRKDSIAEDIKMPMINIIDFLKDKFKTIEFKKGKSEVVVRVANIMAINVSAHKLKIFYNQNLNYAVEEYVGQLSTYEDLLMNNNFIKISREYGES